MHSVTGPVWFSTTRACATNFLSIDTIKSFTLSGVNETAAASNCSYDSIITYLKLFCFRSLTNKPLTGSLNMVSTLTWSITEGFLLSCYEIIEITNWNAF